MNNVKKAIKDFGTICLIVENCEDMFDEQDSKMLKSIDFKNIWNVLNEVKSSQK